MSAEGHTGEQPIEHQPDEREQLKEEIERVREDLGETVEALAGKADVKAQVQDRVDDAKAQAQDRMGQAKAQAQDRVEQVKAQLGSELAARSKLRRSLQGPAVPAGVAALCAVLLVGSMLRRRR